MILTRDDVTRIHGVLVLNEAEAIHELDLGDLASAMGLEVGLYFGLGGIAGKVAQIQAGGGDFCHGGGIVGNVVPIGGLAWKDSERMSMVNGCLAMDAHEVCQQRGRHERHGGREPVARMTRSKGSQRDARGVSNGRNTTAVGRT